MTDKLLRVHDIKKYFKLPSGKILKAVDGVSFNVYDNETVGIIGESGCGKSTLARIISGATEATDGEIYFKGEQIGKKRSRELCQSIHLVFQDSDGALNPRMSIYESLSEALSLLDMKEELQKDRIKKLLHSVGLEERYGLSFPEEISGGQRQRVAVARALAMHPKLLIADEPIASLDVSVQAQILNLLLDVKEKEKFSMIFIAHDLAVVRHISDRTIVMYKGVIVEEGPTEELFLHPGHDYTKILLASILYPDPERERNKGISCMENLQVSHEGVLREVSPEHWVRMKE